ncbi:MAG: hypothetical protein RIS08_630 [Actinomycetota bacterium]
MKPGSKKGNLVVDTPPYLDVFVREKPEDGKANRAVMALLAAHFQVEEEQIRIVSGASSRIKLIEIGGPEGT